MSVAQGYTDNLLTSEELKADADYYFKTLYDRHPNPYYYYSLEEFEDIKNKIYSQLNQPLTKEQFAWIICEINSYVDRHSLIDEVSPDNLQNDFFQEKVNLFPVVKIKENKLFLADDLKDNITEINGMPVSEILSDNKKYFNRKLPHEPNIRMMESGFPFFLYNKYKFTSPYHVKFGSSNIIKTLDGMSLDEYLVRSFGTINVRGARKNNMDSLKIYSYKVYPNSSVAIFYINTFNGGSKDEFDNVLKKFTEEVNNQNIKCIFYDLSKNRGGQFGGYEALDIIKHDTVYFRRTEIARHDGFNRKTDINEIVLMPNFDIVIPQDRKLFVFQSDYTMSRGDYFCRIVKENNLGILVGENTREPTVAFSWTNHYEMPNSKIGFNCATTLVDFSDYFNSETLNPDIYWDIRHNREFTEKELIEIINHYKKNVQIK